MFETTPTSDCPVADIDVAAPGSLNASLTVIRLVYKKYRRLLKLNQHPITIIVIIMGDPRQTAFIFQRLSVIVQRCNAVSVCWII